LAVVQNYALDGQGHLYLGSQNGYEINFLSLERNLIRIIGRDFDPIPITKKDQDEMLREWNVRSKDSIQFPEVYPPYGNFILTDEGRLLVKT